MTMAKRQLKRKSSWKGPSHATGPQAGQAPVQTSQMTQMTQMTQITQMGGMEWPVGVKNKEKHRFQKKSLQSHKRVNDNVTTHHSPINKSPNFFILDWTNP